MMTYRIRKRRQGAPSPPALPWGSRPIIRKRQMPCNSLQHVYF